MSRNVVRWGWAILVSGVVGGQAPAQIISVPNPITGGRFNYARYNMTMLNVPTAYGSFTYNSLNFGGGRNQAMGAAALSYTAQSGYLSGGVGGVPIFGGVAAVDPKAAKKQAALAQAQRQAAARPGGAVEARAAIADQWAYEVGAKPTAPAAGGPPRNINPNLLGAAPEEIASGFAVNDLLMAIRPLEDSGRVAESALLPPDLLARVEFAGGPTADGINQLRAGTLFFPAVLRDHQYDELRRALATDYAALLEAVGGPRPAVIAAADRLVASARKGREAVTPALREMAFPEAVDTARFFHRLEAAARVQRDPATASAYVPSWAALGVTVKELTRQMAKYKLTFAPAAATDGGAYEVLYHGMADYYIGLARAGK